jgi:hypothetical protein
VIVIECLMVPFLTGLASTSDAAFNVLIIPLFGSLESKQGARFARNINKYNLLK